MRVARVGRARAERVQSVHHSRTVSYTVKRVCTALHTVKRVFVIRLFTGGHRYSTFKHQASRHKGHDPEPDPVPEIETLLFLETHVPRGMTGRTRPHEHDNVCRSACTLHPCQTHDRTATAFVPHPLPFLDLLDPGVAGFPLWRPLGASMPSSSSSSVSSSSSSSSSESIVCFSGLAPFKFCCREVGRACFFFAERFLLDPIASLVRVRFASMRGATSV